MTPRRCAFCVELIDTDRDPDAYDYSVDHWVCPHCRDTEKHPVPLPS